MSQIFEVKIKKQKVNYVATCQLFPECRGIGKTRKEALNSLSRSIGAYIGKVARGTFSDVLNSDQYTEIMMDHTRSTHEETIGFSLDLRASIPKHILFKFPINPLTESPKEGPYHVEEPAAEFLDHLVLPFDKDDDDSMEGSLMEPVSFQHKSAADSDSFVFGFPLNFN